MSADALFDVKPARQRKPRRTRATSPVPAAATLSTSPHPKVIGLDLSLTGTGVAGYGWADTIKTKARGRGDNRTDFVHNRVDLICNRLAAYLPGVQLAVIEALAVGPGMDMDRQLAFLSWRVRHLLWKRGIPYALASTGNVKKYAIGKGKRTSKQIADDDAAGKTVKDPVLEAVRGWHPWFAGDDNAADACVLYAIGRDWLGAPVVTVPDLNRQAIAGVTWPERPPIRSAAA